jgi:plastocyanin
MLDVGSAMKRMRAILPWLALLAACIPGTSSWAQDKSVTVNVAISRAETTNAKTAGNRIPDASNVAVWLTPLEHTVATSEGFINPQKPPQLVQRRKTFEPHVLVVRIGTMVEFPNKDPFFHNIFSLYDGRRFDLGLYEAGTARSVRFDRPGISFLFCNIHAEMSAVVLAVDTPYFGLSDRNGSLVIHNVPDGRYQINVWYERGSPAHLKGLTRVITISDASRNLGLMHILENPDFTVAHQNKYGLDYVPPVNPDYDHQ